MAPPDLERVSAALIDGIRTVVTQVHPGYEVDELATKWLANTLVRGPAGSLSLAAHIY